MLPFEHYDMLILTYKSMFISSSIDKATHLSTIVYRDDLVFSHLERIFNDCFVVGLCRPSSVYFLSTLDALIDDNISQIENPRRSLG